MKYVGPDIRDEQEEIIRKKICRSIHIKNNGKLKSYRLSIIGVKRLKGGERDSIL